MASSSNCKRSTTTKDEKAAADATDLSKLVLQEISFVKESFEAVKIKASKKIDEANEAEKQFEELMSLPVGRAEERDYKLRQLKMKVSKLRMDIPFKLIAPSEHPNHPNINRWRRLESDLYGGDKEISHNSFQPDIDDHDDINPVPYHEIESILRGIQFSERLFVACFVFFPKNAVIKRCVLFSPHETLLDTSNKGLGFLVEKGLVEAVYKKSNLSVDGYRMHPSVHSYLRSEESGFRGLANMYVGRSHDVEQKFIYHTAQDFQQFINNSHTGHVMKTVLHLGKWNNSTEQHIEIIDPELFFKLMSKHTELRYVSLRGISMIKVLPNFITKLEWLEHLDLRACHNLEVIPPSIANLKYSLRYLDISECYFLDHMPKALSSFYFLKVLKGFVVGENKDGKSCSLEHLRCSRFLQKLNIYSAMKRFPTKSQFQTLQGFGWLVSLTISWGGCKPSQEYQYKWLEELEYRDYFFVSLEKLDLQCVPESVTRHWLKPSKFKNLKKLYIRGGNFFDLGQSTEGALEKHYMRGGKFFDLGPSPEGSPWNVETLRLKHLSKLNMNWDELQRLFPKLISLEKVNCPNAHQFPCNDNGIWMKNQQA